MNKNNTWKFFNTIITGTLRLEICQVVRNVLANKCVSIVKLHTLLHRVFDNFSDVNATADTIVISDVSTVSVKERSRYGEVT